MRAEAIVGEDGADLTRLQEHPIPKQNAAGLLIKERRGAHPILEQGERALNVMGADLERAGLVVVGVTDGRPVVALHDPRLLSVAHLLPEAARAPVDP